MKALLLIGGLATRLLPLSSKLPKSLLPVCDREILHYQITQLAYAGISDIVLAAGHLVDQLREFTSHYSGGLNFHFSIESEPLGTAGAIAHAAEFLEGEPVVVLNADILSSVMIDKLVKAHTDGGRPATLTGFAVKDPARYGLLRVEGDALTGFSEKPEGDVGPGQHYVNAGIYVLEPEVYQSIPTGRAVSIERQTFPMLLGRHGSLTHYGHDGLWIDVGTFESYLAANFILLAYRYAEGEDWLWGQRNDCAVFKDMIYIAKTAQLGSGVDLFHRVMIMRECVVGDNCRMHNCLMLPGAVIGADSELTDCIIGPGAQVPAKSRLTSLIVCNGEKNVPFFPHAV